MIKSNITIALQQSKKKYVNNCFILFFGVCEAYMYMYVYIMYMILHKMKGNMHNKCRLVLYFIVYFTIVWRKNIQTDRYKNIENSENTTVTNRGITFLKSIPCKYNVYQLLNYQSIEIIMFKIITRLYLCIYSNRSSDKDLDANMFLKARDIQHIQSIFNFVYILIISLLFIDTRRPGEKRDIDFRKFMNEKHLDIVLLLLLTQVTYLYFYTDNHTFSSISIGKNINLNVLTLNSKQCKKHTSVLAKIVTNTTHNFNPKHYIYTILSNILIIETDSLTKAHYETLKVITKIYDSLSRMFFFHSRNKHNIHDHSYCLSHMADYKYVGQNPVSQRGHYMCSTGKGFSPDEIEVAINHFLMCLLIFCKTCLTYYKSIIMNVQLYLRAKIMLCIFISMYIFNHG